MDNFNNGSFYPDDQWQSISQPVLKADVAESNIDNDEVKAEAKPKKHNKHPVLTIQLIISLCILLFLFIIRFLSAPLYTAVISWYESEISKSVIYNGDFESFDYSSLFSTSDEG